MKTRSDIIVIGAGIVGLSSAYYLARSGHSVIVLEKSDGSDSASYGNAGYICPSHFIALSSPGIVAKGIRWMLNPESPFYIKPRLSLSLAKWGWQFLKHANQKHVDNTKRLLADMSIMSLDLHREIIGEANSNIDYSGIMMHCVTEAAMKHERDLAAMAQDLGITANILDIDQLNQLDPEVSHAGVGAVHFPDDAFTNPRLTMNRLKELLTELNVTIHHDQEVIDFHTKANKISRVITNHADYEADNIILATGSYTAPILRLIGSNLLLEAGKGYSVDYFDGPSLPKYAHILIEARVAITPMNKFLRLAGTMEFGGINHNINPRRVAGYLKSIANYFPDIRYDNVKNLPVWAGLRPCSPDGLPYVGRDKKYNNLVIAAGHAMLGFTLGPVTGKLVSEIIEGKPTSLNIEQLATDRY